MPCGMRSLRKSGIAQKKPPSSSDIDNFVALPIAPSDCTTKFCGFVSCHMRKKGQVEHVGGSRPQHVAQKEQYSTVQYNTIQYSKSFLQTSPNTLADFEQDKGHTYLVGDNILLITSCFTLFCLLEAACHRAWMYPPKANPFIMASRNAAWPSFYLSRLPVRALAHG